MQPDEPPALEGIAIIGMAGRFPGAANVGEFWRNLVDGVDAISRFCPEGLEYSVATAADQLAGQKFVRARGVLERADEFDASFFDINPREAELMDPQHRIFLECAWEALEMAGHDADEFPGLIGLYAGCSLNTYLLYNLCQNRAFAARLAGNYQVADYLTMMGNDKDYLPTRTSYKLNLKGPSFAVQSACSTSLVAVSQACTSLLTYQCDMALAGGVSVTFPQKRDYLFVDGSLVSGAGICRAFDAAADGTVFGHGAGVVLLKRLAEALAEGDHILAVITGTAVNNDGLAKVSYAAPSVQGQSRVIAAAQAAAGIRPETISYVEAHGTGTPLGDPIEVAALTQAFRAGGASGNNFCALSTAKTNIGHLEAAAGVTGLIKTVLQLNHELIPPLLHFKNPNPKIDFAHSPFFPVTKTMPWKRGEKTRRAGVSSFGVGGTNAHVIVEEAPKISAASPSRAQQLLVLSAKSDAALQKMTENLAAHLLAHPAQNLGDVAFTLKKGRKSFAHRRAFVASDVAEAVGKLSAGASSPVISGQAQPGEPAVVFLFPGQGAQFVDMGRGLYDSEPVFRREVDRCAEILREPLGLDIRSVIYPAATDRSQAEKKINQTAVTQPAIFTVEYALAKLWLSWGVKPAALIGHSIGEYVAAVLAETFTLEDALQLLAVRARLLQQLPGGAMLAVRLGGEAIAPTLPAEISVAAFNSPKLCVVSGPTEVLNSFQKELEAKNIAARFLATSHAFHSAMMEPILAEFTEFARATPWAAPKTPWISTCTGTWITEADLADPAYWSRQIRRPVRFAAAFELALQGAPKIILEVGPGQALSQMAQQMKTADAKNAGVIVCSTLDPSNISANETAFILTSLGKLWVAGVKPDWNSFYAGEERRRLPLPTYPFERTRHWVEPAAPDENLIAGAPAISEISANETGADDAALTPGLLEKVIRDQLRLMNEQLEKIQAAQTNAAADPKSETKP